MMRRGQSFFVALALGIFVLSLFVLFLAPLFAGVALSTALIPKDDASKALLILIPTALFTVLLFNVISGLGQ